MQNILLLRCVRRAPLNGAMQSIEVLLTIAAGAGPVFEKVRKMIGEDELAILIAKAALADTSAKLSPTKVSEAIGIHRTTAQDKIDNLAVRNA